MEVSGSADTRNQTISNLANEYLIIQKRFRNEIYKKYPKLTTNIEQMSRNRKNCSKIIELHDTSSQKANVPQCEWEEFYFKHIIYQNKRVEFRMKD